MVLCSRSLRFLWFDRVPTQGFLPSIYRAIYSVCGIQEQVRLTRDSQEFDFLIDR